ncbi:Thoeris anti-defense Tad2 family protein [Streptomyces kronopolitis]|uniref:Thoeris anti-defense Tad2 family protein n=1 Tax=Streptomyces kronopolitis TaxID=1612435 RepID=UPI003F56FCC8
MNFSATLEPLRHGGRRMACRSWIQPGKYVPLGPEASCPTLDNRDRTVEAPLWFATVNGTVQVDGGPSHAGLLADDWYGIDGLEGR